MSAALLDELVRLDVRVDRDGDRLLLDGPSAVLTDELLETIAAAKLELLHALDAAASIPQISSAPVGTVAPHGTVVMRQP